MTTTFPQTIEQLDRAVMRADAVVAQAVEPEQREAAEAVALAARLAVAQHLLTQEFPNDADGFRATIALAAWFRSFGAVMGPVALQGLTDLLRRPSERRFGHAA